MNAIIRYIRSTPALALLIVRALRHPHIRRQTKIRLIASGLYWLTPFDFLPEKWLGKIAFVDDVMICLSALDALLNEEDPLVIASLWQGDISDLQRLQSEIHVCTSFIQRTSSPWIDRALNALFNQGPRRNFGSQY